MGRWKRRLRYYLPKKKKRCPQREQKIRNWVLIVAAVLALGILFFRIEERLGGFAQQAAISELNRILNREIHRTVGELMEEEQTDFHSLSHTQTDAEGRVLSVSTDHQSINRIKSRLAVRVGDFLEELTVVNTKVPMGALVSDSWMTGFGIPIPVKVFATNSIAVEIADSFISAGINQTRYKLELLVTVPARVAGFLEHQDTEVTVQIPIEEIILVGEVPNAYLASNH